MSFFRQNLSLIIVLILLTIVGFVVQYSASINDNLQIFKKQLMFFLLFLPISFSFCWFFLEKIKKNIYIIYGLSLLVLSAVLIMGKTAMGATRWLEVGGINVQPAEFVKLILILVLARYFSNARYFNLNKIGYFLIPIALIFVPFFLIFLQPNLGTATINLIIGLSIIFAFFDRTKVIFLIIFLMLGSVPLIWHFGLHNYQKQRILTFLNPDKDIRGSGYNVNQSKIAIGSGQVFGKGFLKGDQSKLYFLPEQHTDFVFTVFAEEFGWFWTSALILLYMILIFKVYWACLFMKNLEDKIILYGIAVFLFAHVFINIGMSMGLLPVVGVPLPMISYGRSFFLLNLLIFSLLIIVLYRNYTPKIK